MQHNQQNPEKKKQWCTLIKLRKQEKNAGQFCGIETLELIGKRKRLFSRSDLFQTLKTSRGLDI